MSGFQNAPVIKGIIFTTAIVSLSVSLSGLKPYMHLAFTPHMSQYHQWWRFATYQAGFTNSVEMLMAFQALYIAGVTVERCLGSRKFASFIFLSYLFSSATSFLLLLLGHRWGLNYLPSGCFGLIGAIIGQHRQLVPPLYTVRIFHARVTNKVFLYLFVVLLLYHQLPGSLFVFIPGVIFSKIYTLSSNPHSYASRLQLSSLRLPDKLYHIVAPFSLLADSTPPGRHERALPIEFGDLPGARAARRRAEARRARAQAMVEGTMRRVNEIQVARDAALGAATSITPRPTATTTTPTPPATATTSEGSGTLSRLGLGSFVNQVGLRAGDVVGMTRTGLPTEEEGAQSEQTAGTTTASAPSQTEISAIMSMFPNIPRATVVEALQRSNWNSAAAVETLLDETTL